MTSDKNISQKVATFRVVFVPDAPVSAKLLLSGVARNPDDGILFAYDRKTGGFVAVTSRLLGEIRQTKPFESPRVEVWLNLQRTAAVLSHGLEQQLRPLGLSLTQYNVLRILRGAGCAGLCQGDIGDRLVAQVPDVPRILERMEKAGWVRRERADQDRRLVMATLSVTGRALVDELDGPMRKMTDEMFPGMDDARLCQLNDLLVAARLAVE